MDSWITLNLGAIVLDKYFDTEEEAELYALAMAAATGEHYTVKRVWGSAV